MNEVHMCFNIMKQGFILFSPKMFRKCWFFFDLKANNDFFILGSSISLYAYIIIWKNIYFLHLISFLTKAFTWSLKGRKYSILGLSIHFSFAGFLLSTLEINSLLIILLIIDLMLVKKSFLNPVLNGIPFGSLRVFWIISKS